MIQTTKVHCLRLAPAQDLKLELSNFCKIQQIKAGCIVSAVGSLQRLQLRLANSSQTLSLNQKFEIVSMTGTISIHGSHVHLSVADSDGKVWGGHLMDENIIFTTCELVILELTGYEFKRELDPATTFKELKIYLMKS